ncbi:NmrA family NAD(P)-binding protein [Caulobacter sp. BK020]|uniref:NmrA family NAD(P)-binding protein n=1 Tax=Caulobacter sp. BK020 TaxID=2512117 RepID=UPI00104F95C5|nr:NmrA family NAD(P)-binding protein [Caulobacter sp. BK020]TCS12308.1 uncharacterized protein YbjT (DUF2867 family) [Caulobacter sp. BK020]
MFVVLGASGHVGSAVAETLLEAGEPVTVVVRSAEKAAAWRARGAQAAVADVLDPDGLRAVLRRGRRAFLLNPPAAPSTDTEVEEHRTVAGIVAALEGSGLEKVVAESTYGAQPGQRCGDLNVLYDFEQALAVQPIPATVQRTAYYMSNWDAALDQARQGVLPTMLPADLKLPMVAPVDLGRAAADFLREPIGQDGIRYVEGPARYSPADVAAAFARALGRPVEVSVTPRDQWEQAYRDLGFSEAAAESYTRMTQATADGPLEPEAPRRGSVTLERYVAELVRRSGG